MQKRWDKFASYCDEILRSPLLQYATIILIKCCIFVAITITNNANFTMSQGLAVPTRQGFSLPPCLALRSPE